MTAITHWHIGWIYPVHVVNFLLKNIIDKEVKIIMNRNNLLEARSSNTDLMASMTYFVPI